MWISVYSLSCSSYHCTVPFLNESCLFCDSLVVGSVFVSTHEPRLDDSVNFLVVPLTPTLTPTILSSALQPDSPSSAQCLVVDLCKFFLQFSFWQLDEESIYDPVCIFNRFKNLVVVALWVYFLVFYSIKLLVCLCASTIQLVLLKLSAILKY